MAEPRSPGDMNEVEYANAAATQELYGAISTRLTEIAGAQKVIAGTTHTPEYILAADLGALKTQERMQGLAAAAGLSADMNIDIQAELLRNIQSDYRNLQSVLKGIEADKAVSLWENPLDAIVNAFTIPWDEQEAEGIKDSLNLKVKTLNDLSGGLTAAGNAAQSFQQKTTQAALLERSEALKGLLKQQELEILNKTDLNTIASVKYASEVSDKILDRDWKYYTMQATQEQREVARLQRAEYLRILDEKRADKKLNEAALEESLNYYNKAAVRLGQPQFASIAEMQSKSLVGEQKKRISAMIEMGYELSSTAGLISAGDNVQDNLKRLDLINYRPNTKRKQILVGAMQEVVGAAATQGKDPLAKVVSAEAGRDKKIAELEHVKSGDDANPFQAMPLELLVQQPGFAGNKVVQEILKPAVSAGMGAQSAHPELVAALVNKAIREKKIDPTIAAGNLGAFYKRVIFMNNAENDVQLITGRKQEHFYVSLPTSLSPGKVLGGLAAGGAGPVAAVAGHPVIGAAVGLAGAAYAATAAIRPSKIAFDAADPVAWRNYLVRTQTGFSE